MFTLFNWVGVPGQIEESNGEEFIRCAVNPCVEYNRSEN